ncbi:MAG: dihydropteroate synthase [Treponemataceae bacterium]
MTDPDRVALPRGRFLELSHAPLVMAIVNCTPDSFYAKSRASTSDTAIERSLAAEASGAAIIDLGGESTRPGAAYVEAEEEIDRILPVVEGIRKRSGVPISVDTRKTAVARAALEAGADIINDISALEDDDELGPLCAAAGAAVVLMHKKGTPDSMQTSPFYNDVVAEVRDYLEGAVRRAEGYGIARAGIIIDPGIGFGKRFEDNFDILAGLAEIGRSGYPILIGLSRKGFIGTITGKVIEERLAGTLAANAAAIAGGAKILRVHDVAETFDLIRVFSAITLRNVARKGIS